MSNTKNSWQEINSIQDIVCNYTPKTCLRLLQLIYSMHTAFPNILSAKATVGTFEGRSRTSFLTNYTLKKWLQKFRTGVNRASSLSLGASAAARVPIELPTNDEAGNLTPADMAAILFSTASVEQPGKQDAEGLLGWYFPNDLDHAVLCQVVNPYHMPRRHQTMAFQKASSEEGYDEYNDAELIYITRYQVSAWCSAIQKNKNKNYTKVQVSRDLNKYCNKLLRFRNQFNDKWNSWSKKKQKDQWTIFAGEEILNIGKRFNKFPPAVIYMYDSVKQNEQARNQLKQQIKDLLLRGNCFGLDTGIDEESWLNIIDVLITQTSAANINTFPGNLGKINQDYKLPKTLVDSLATKDANGDITAYKIHPGANSWLRTSGARYNRPWTSAEDAKLIIQQISKTKNNEIEFSLIGREFVLEPKDFNRFFLIPRDENGLDVILTSPTLRANWSSIKLKQSVCFTLAESNWNEAATDQSGILRAHNSPTLDLDTKTKWSPVMQMMVRDAYDKYGKLPLNQESV